MNDPLHNFDWTRLYERYDELCVRFNPAVDHLRAFALRPPSDRYLYYDLIRSIHAPPACQPDLSIDFYEAILYWKLYSQPPAIANLQRWLPPEDRPAIAVKLTRLVSTLPTAADLKGNVTTIINLIEELGEYELPGIKTNTALPVRTTLLHFLFPHVVPIFDRMVLEAVGVGERQNIGILKEYVDHVWTLAGRHAAHFFNFPLETPVRLIDMALWVSRGGCA
jgi:hypothetical protein